jgi:hypothetical protein
VELGVKGLAVALIAVLTAVNYIGVKFGGLVQNLFTGGQGRGDCWRWCWRVVVTPGVGAASHLTVDT